MKSVISHKLIKIEQRNYDHTLYCFRRIIENIFLVFKPWRGMAVCYAKALDTSIASNYVRCIFMLL